MKKPQVIIFSGYGINCEAETKAAFEFAGASADIVHINDAIARPAMLKEAQILAFPGGFSYADDTGSGKAYGNRLKQHLGGALQKFFARDTLAIGICNGFQVLTSAGILPGALLANDSGKFLCRWVDLKVESASPWLSGIDSLSLPIAHGEGKYYADEKSLKRLDREGALALRYTEGPTAKHFSLPANPNGALQNIAGVTALGGRVLGLMPHPERAVRFTQLPHWTYLKETYVRDGVPTPTEGPGIEMFRNAVRYFA